MVGELFGLLCPDEHRWRTFWLDVAGSAP
jgi:hypothetical protein